MIKKILAATVLFTFLFNIQTSFSQTVINMLNEGGVFLIPNVKVNGIPMDKFIFDTGASSVSISIVEALFLFKQGKLKEEDIIGSSFSQIADGSVAENTVIILKVIELEGLKLTNVRALISHNNKAPLLFGQSAIQKLGKFELDGNKLTISNGDTKVFNFNEIYIPQNSEAGHYAQPEETYWLKGYISTNKVPNEEIISSTETCNTKERSKIWEEREMKGKLIGSGQGKVKLIHRIFDYWKVEFNGQTGWVWEKYLDLPLSRSWIANL